MTAVSLFPPERRKHFPVDAYSSIPQSAETTMFEEPDLESLNSAYHLLQTKPGPEAITKLEQLAELGSLSSMIHLGWAHQHGVGTKENSKQAEIWFRRAYEGRSNLAIYYLGHLYLNQKDYLNAEKVFTSGLEVNYSPAIFCLGCMYLEGTGVIRQPEKALLLFEKASNLGHVFAKRYLAKMLLGGKYGKGKFFKGIVLLIASFKEAILLAKNDPHSDLLRA